MLAHDVERNAEPEAGALARAARLVIRNSDGMKSDDVNSMCSPSNFSHSSSAVILIDEPTSQMATLASRSARRV